MAPAYASTTRPAADVKTTAVASAAELKAEVESVQKYISGKYKVPAKAVQTVVSAAWEVGGTMQLDPLLLLAVMAIESSFNPKAQSHKGAQGLMQVMTRIHHKKFEPFGGVKAAWKPEANIEVGAQILKDCIKRRGSISGGLTCYVGSPGTVSQYGKKVLAERERLAKVFGGPVLPDAATLMARSNATKSRVAAKQAPAKEAAAKHVAAKDASAHKPAANLAQLTEAATASETRVSDANTQVAVNEDAPKASMTVKESPDNLPATVVPDVRLAKAAVTPDTVNVDAPNVEAAVRVVASASSNVSTAASAPATGVPATVTPALGAPAPGGPAAGGPADGDHATAESAVVETPAVDTSAAVTLVAQASATDASVVVGTSLSADSQAVDSTTVNTNAAIALVAQAPTADASPAHADVAPEDATTRAIGETAKTVARGPVSTREQAEAPHLASNDYEPVSSFTISSLGM